MKINYISTNDSTFCKQDRKSLFTSLLNESILAIHEEDFTRANSMLMLSRVISRLETSLLNQDK